MSRIVQLSWYIVSIVFSCVGVVCRFVWMFGIVILVMNVLMMNMNCVVIIILKVSQWWGLDIEGVEEIWVMIGFEKRDECSVGV